MSTAVLTTDLKETIRLLPGYDPYDQAGDCWFDEECAQNTIAFVQACCTHVKGELAGQTIKLEPWQQAIFANLWGWKRPDGTRRYREALIFIPRGNAKTTMAAAMINVGLFLDDEPGAELYSAASERQQAHLCHEITAGMIRNEPEMDRRATIYKHSIVVGDKSYKALSAEAGTKHGFNVQMLVNDELHAQKTPELTEVLLTGMGKRRQPMAIHLTTSDYEREGSICNTKYDYACAVRDNNGDTSKPGYDPAFLPVIYEASKEDDWTDPKIWAKANPNFGISVPEDYLARECQRAREDPGYENTFKRLHLDIRTQSVNQWITEEHWNACQADIHIGDYAGKPCWLAIDVASTEDFNAALFVFRDDSNEALPPAVAAALISEPDDADPDDDTPPLHASVRVAVFPYFWVPEETAIRREREKRIPYSVWAKGGHLTLCPERVIGSARLTRDVKRIIAQHKLQVVEMPVDRAFQGLDVILALVAEGYNAYDHGQGSLGMIGPTKQTKNLIYARKLRHAGHPVMRWMMNNVVVHAGDNKEFPMRDKSSDKIDGPVAMIMGVGRAVCGETNASFYNSNEVRYL